MEGSSRLSSLSCSSRSATKEKKSDESVGHKESCTQESSKEDELESATAKMKEVKDENARLKTTLEKLQKDYRSLQKKFIDTVNQLDVSKNVCYTNAACSTIEDTDEEPEFVSLRLGTTMSPPTPVPKKDNNDEKVSSFSKSESEDQEQLKCGLKLGLDDHLGGSKSDPTVEVSPVHSLDERKDHGHEDGNAVETWPPNKVLKTARNEDDELSQQPNPKRARVSVRVRCDTPTMNDGCQWRKYGQKIAKGNPCPRAYYRCTVAPACPVRKQVQRCAEDMSILVTTYEGTHNHQLAISATAMASTTSAAASMLLSGSLSSQPGHGSTPTTNFHGLNVELSSDASKTRAFYLPNTSTPAFPTITLDLTSTIPSTNPFNSFSTFQPNQTPFPSKNLNFASFESNNSSIPPTIWGNGYLNNYGKLPYNKPNLGSLNLGGQAAAQAQQLSHSYLDKNNQQPLAETITKALTSDPSFQSVIAATISSMFSGNGRTQGGEERSSQILKWGESAAHPTSSAPLSLSPKGCASSAYLTQPSSSSTLTGSLTATQPTSLPFSVSKTDAAAQTKPS